MFNHTGSDQIRTFLKFGADPDKGIDLGNVVLGPHGVCSSDWNCGFLFGVIINEQ